MTRAAKIKKKEPTFEDKLNKALISEDEWLYKLPENWCWAKLGAYIDYATDYVANGSFASLKENVNIYKDENYALMVKTADFASDFTKSLTYTDKHGYEYLSKSVLYGGELILSNIGSIGKVFRVPFFNKPMTLASNSVMIKCHNVLDYDWLYYYFLSPLGFQELMRITTGTAVLKFNKTDLKTIALPIPPRDEQQRIVDRIESLFAKLDEAKEKAEAVVDGYENRKAAILHKAFTGELTEKWRDEHNTKIDEWQHKTINSICRSLKYGTAKKSEKEGTVVVIRMGNLQQGEIDWSDLVYTSDLDDIEKYYLKPGDVLFNRTNSAALVGKTSIYRGEYPAIYAGYLIKLDYYHDVVIGEFLNYALNTHNAKEYCNSVKTDGVNQSNINAKKIGAYEIPIPSLEEQKVIVRILNETIKKEQKVKETAEQIVEQIEIMKKSILANAFRGELGTNDPSDESAEELLKQILQES